MTESSPRADRVIDLVGDSPSTTLATHLQDYPFVDILIELWDAPPWRCPIRSLLVLALAACNPTAPADSGDTAPPCELRTWYEDLDGDGHGSSSSVSACDVPAGYVETSDDCDDRDAYTFPGAQEVCDTLDNDCNGLVDDGSDLANRAWYADSDGDGWGSSAQSVEACVRPDGYVTSDRDCDDSLADVFPGAIETCNDRDDNCDDVIDEGCDPPVVSTQLPEVPSCTPHGWCWAFPAEQRVDLHAVWVAPDGQRFAVGDAGTVLADQGTGWQTVRYAAGPSLRAIWGSSAEDWWAVGESGELLHREGATITRESAPTSATLSALIGFASDDVFTGGEEGLYHYDGTTWASAIPTWGVAPIHALWGTSADDLYAGSWWGQARHWDGSQGTYLLEGNALGERITAIVPMGGSVWATGPSDDVVELVGYNGRHTNWWVGTHYDMSVTNDAELWVVGQQGGHWDGNSWSALDVDSTRGLRGLDGSLAVGEDGRVVELSTLSIQRGGATTATDLGAITGAANNDLWVSEGTAVRHWDGSNLSAPEVVDPSQTWFHPVTDLWWDGSTLWATTQDGVFRRESGSWTLVGASSSSSRIWGLDASHIWFAGDEIRVWDGAQLSSTYLGETLHAVHGSSANDVWACGERGLYSHWDGSSWTRVQPSPPSQSISWCTAIHAFSPSDVWFANDAGHLLQWDGTTLHDRGAVLGGDFVADLVADAPDDVFVSLQVYGFGGLGERGQAIAHWDGTSWSLEADGGATAPRRLHLLSDTLWGTSRNGSPLRRAR